MVYLKIAISDSHDNYDNDNNDNKTFILRHISKLGSLIGTLHTIQSTGYFIVTFKVYIYVQLKTFSEQMSFEC